MGELLKNPKARVISCHLGGSSSMCAIQDGKSQATSMGMSPQSGLPNNNRIGDFDPFALPVLLRGTGKTLEQLLDDLAERSGLLGLSGFNDLRDIEAAAAKNDPKARVALDVFVASVRHYLGAYLLLLGGAGDRLHRRPAKTRWRCEAVWNLEWFGIRSTTREQIGEGEARIDAANSACRWIMPAGEEIIVAS